MSRETREQARQLTWLTEAQAAVGWAIVLVLAALLGTIYLRQASQIAAVGRRVQALQIELENVKRESTDIERQIAEAQSLERLQAEAIRLGFTVADPDDIEYIIVPDYPVDGEEETVVSPSPPSSKTLPQSMEEAMMLQFRNSIDNLMRGEAGE